MNARAWLLGIAAVASGAAGSAGAAELGSGAPVDKIIECMRGNVPPTLRVQEVELTSTDRSGSARNMKGRLFAMRESGLVRSMLRIAEPADLSGAAYLVRESAPEHPDEMYMYLPSVNRVRRITGASADGSLFGTDFSYNDVKQIENAFDSTVPKLEAPESIQGRPTWVMDITPKSGQDSRYSLVKSWVDQKTCVALKIDFLEGDKIRKELTAPVAGLQQSDKFWYLSEAQMRDLKEGTKTDLKIIGVTSGSDLPSRYFDAHSFFLGN